MQYRRTLPILVAGILLGGSAIFVARHQVLVELRSAVASVSVQSGGGDVTEFNVSTGAARAVPTLILRLRAENQALHREVEVTTERIRNLTQTPTFDPADSPAAAAHAAFMEEMRQMSSGPDFEDASALGRALTEWIKRNDGRLPKSLNEVRPLVQTPDDASSTGTTGRGGSGPSAGAGLTYELLSAGESSAGRQARVLLARSAEIPLSSGKLARFFIRSDGNVLLAVVEESSDWNDWMAEQEAHAGAPSPSQGD